MFNKCSKQSKTKENKHLSSSLPFSHSERKKMLQKWKSIWKIARWRTYRHTYKHTRLRGKLLIYITRTHTHTHSKGKELNKTAINSSWKRNAIERSRVVWNYCAGKSTVKTFVTHTLSHTHSHTLHDKQAKSVAYFSAPQAKFSLKLLPSCAACKLSRQATAAGKIRKQTHIHTHTHTYINIHRATQTHVNLRATYAY